MSTHRHYWGAGGNDFMVGGGADILHGEGGEDRLVFYDSRLGETKGVDGGEGNDIIYIQGVYGQTWIYGGNGVDWLDFFHANAFYDQYNGYRYRSVEGAGVNIDLSHNTGWTYYTSANGATWVDSNGRLNIYDIENLSGTQQGDRLVGNASANQIYGNDGNDYIDGGGGADTLVGGWGNDHIVLRDGYGAMWASGGEGDDTVEYRGVYGTAGIDGGAGSDWLSFANANAFSYWDGNVRYRSAEGAGVNIDLASGTGWSYYWGSGTWIDALGRLSISNIENLRGTGQGDRLVGNWMSNEINGQEGNDYIDGGGGADTLLGGKGNDHLVLRDGAGAMRASGGEGDDLVEYLGVYGATAIDGGSGTDWLSFANADAFAQADGYVRYRSAEGAGVNIDLDSGTGWSYYWGSGTWMDALGRLSISNIENLRGTAQGDRLVGDWGANTINGQEGSDYIHGGWGADAVMGGKGNDTLDGGAGVDMLTGGTGSDRFVFSAGPTPDHTDTVTDYNVYEGDTFAMNGAAYSQLVGKGHLSNHFRWSTQAPSGGDDYIVYDWASGGLFYDASGNGSSAQLFATLSNRPQDLSGAQFFVI